MAVSAPMTGIERTAAELRNHLFIDHEIKVGTYDIDFIGHVSNIAYLRWLEDMRTVLFDKYFPLSTFVKVGKSPVLVSTTINYKRPIHLFEEPQGHMWVSKIGLASLTIEAEIFVNGVLTTTAHHVGAFVDLKTGKPTRIPTILREKFRA